MLRIDPRGNSFADSSISALQDHLRAGDLVVVNDAATLPASHRGRGPRGESMEIRLASRHEDGSFVAVLFGDGDWRTATENRPAAPEVRVGDSLAFPEVSAVVASVDRRFPRLLRVRFSVGDDQLFPALYRHGTVVQYSYLRQPLALWDVQTRYAGRPWAFEMPSAGRPLTWRVLTRLRERGVSIVSLTHAAGLSSTGDE
jgi:S-adenosylmethionine:tRNA ribosyltransferase-isomerase